MKISSEDTRKNCESKALLKNIQDLLKASKMYLREKQLNQALKAIYRARAICKSNAGVVNEDKVLNSISNEVNVFYLTCIVDAICTQANKFIKS